MKIGILGAGSIGCYLGAHFIYKGINTVLVGREKIVREISNNGLRITDFRGKDFHLSSKQVNCTTSIESLADRDIILITLKSASSETTAKELKGFLSDKTTVISFQNGVRNASILRSVLTQSEVLAGMVPFNVLWNEAAHFHCGTSGKLVVEKHASSSTSTEKAVSLLNNVGLETKASTNVEGILWGKLIFNLNNAINALAGVPLKEEFSNIGYRKIVAATMNEALFILKKSGVKAKATGGMIPTIAPLVLSLPDFLFFKIAAGMIKIDPQARSSMWQDLKQGRKTEIDYINGEIVNLAKKNNLTAPINTAIIALIKEIEASNQLPRFSAPELTKRFGLDVIT